MRTGGQTNALLFDQCFGGGKTTICFRFREFYGELEGELQALISGSPAQSVRLEAIRRATYVRIVFEPNGINIVGPKIGEWLATSWPSR